MKTPLHFIKKGFTNLKLYHATLKSNLESIKANGLDPNRSKGKEAVVWLHTASRREWAILHTSRKHRVGFDEVTIIEVNVPRSRLRRRWKGLWSTPETLTDFQSITNASELAKSPIA